MSAGKFENSRYESNGGTVYAARVQPETLAATIGGVANAAPAGAVTGEPSAKMSGGKRELGVIARQVSFKWDEGNAPAGYDENTPQVIPVMTPAVFNGISKGDAVVYLGGTGEVTGTSPERIN